MSMLTGIILAKNEERMIGDCLMSLSFCDEIILVDSGSTDQTVAMAKEKGAKIFLDTSSDFAAKREMGMKHAIGNWLLYVDADERVSEPLAAEIRKTVDLQFGQQAAYRLRRKNYYLGNHPWPMVEKMERLFQKSSLKGWAGALHESPEIEGEIGELNGYLVHYTHRDLAEMVAKTNKWSETEAILRLKANHPQMSWWRFPRVMIAAFADSYVKQGGWKAGTAGLIESMFQAFSAFITYAKLWELQQQKDPLSRHET